jgi:FkbM family methyltransferase
MQFLGQTIPIRANCSHVKIDVGLGLHNVQSIHWLKHEKDLFVFMFDPNPDSVASCVERMRKGGAADTLLANGNDLCILPLALADVGGPEERPFYSMALDGGTSSLFRPVDPTLGPIKEVRTVLAVPLRQFFEAFPWDRFPVVDYLKVDVQGADLEVLKSAGPWLAERVIYVTAEPESTAYAGCGGNTREAMENYMQSQGFEAIDHPNTSDPTFVNRRFKGGAAEVYIYQQN